MIYSIQTEDELKAFEKFGELAFRVREVRLPEKIDQQDFHYDTKTIFGQIASAVTDTVEKLLESKSTTKTIQKVL